MEKSLVVFLIGGNCSGKTTQARLLHTYFDSYSKSNIEVIEDKEYCYTSMNKYSANLGKLLNNQCSREDTLGTKARTIE